MTITKNVLIELVMEMTDFKRPEAAKYVEDFFEVIVSALERGDDVKVPGFGNFKLRNKKAREGRNPKTGEPHIISARTVVSFRASNLLKSEVRKNSEHGATEVA